MAAPKTITLTQTPNASAIKAVFDNFGEFDSIQNGSILCSIHSIKATEFDEVFSLTLGGQTFVIASLSEEGITVNGKNNAVDAVAEVEALL
jgi:hypothetical protein